MEPAPFDFSAPPFGHFATALGFTAAAVVIGILARPYTASLG